MKLWVTLEGRDAEVEFHATAAPSCSKSRCRASRPISTGCPTARSTSLIVNGRSHEVRVAPATQGEARAGSLDVTLAGVTFPVEVRHPIEKGAVGAARRGGAGRRDDQVARCRDCWWRTGSSRAIASPRGAGRWSRR